LEDSALYTVALNTQRAIEGSEAEWSMVVVIAEQPERLAILRSPACVTYHLPSRS